MNILVTGVTGYVGAAVVPALLARGHRVCGFARDRQRVASTTRDWQRVASTTRDWQRVASTIPVVQGDAFTGDGLAEALDGADVAYYLIHSMEPSAAAQRFPDVERRAAERFAKAAADAGVGRIVYLGGLLGPDGNDSEHLSSRATVERVLLDHVPGSVALRASIVIGAQSRSFRFLVRLVERMPVLAVPAWHCYRTQPVDERDVVSLLARAADHDAVAGRVLDVGGPDVVTYGELIDRIRDLMLVGRPTVSFRRLTVTPLASAVAALVAGEEPELIRPLMESLGSDLLARDHQAFELLDVRPHRLDAAIEHALRLWERTEPLAAR